MERGYGGRDMLRDFTVQPATGGSPAGKAYTHQFPEHVFLYLGIVFIEHVLFLHREARCWFLIGRGPFYDDILSITITSPVWFHGTHNERTPQKAMVQPLKRSCSHSCDGRRREI